MKSTILNRNLQSVDEIEKPQEIKRSDSMSRIDKEIVRMQTEIAFNKQTLALLHEGFKNDESRVRFQDQVKQVGKQEDQRPANPQDNKAKEP